MPSSLALGPSRAVVLRFFVIRGSVLVLLGFVVRMGGYWWMIHMNRARREEGSDDAQYALHNFFGFYQVVDGERAGGPEERCSFMSTCCGTLIAAHCHSGHR